MYRYSEDEVPLGYSSRKEYMEYVRQQQKQQLSDEISSCDFRTRYSGEQVLHSQYAYGKGAKEYDTDKWVTWFSCLVAI